MQELAGIFLGITLFRRGPRDIPASPALLALASLLYTATSWLQSYVLFGPDQAVPRSLADLALSIAVFAVALGFRRRLYRLGQTLTALLGTGALLSLPMIGMLFLRQDLPDESILALVLSLVSVPLLVWYLCVVGHIARLALDVTLFTGMAVAMTYVVLGYLLIEQMPATGTG